MVAYMEKTDGNTNFHEIIDFLTRSFIQYALTLSCQAFRDISEASIRSDLLFDDTDGIDSMHNQAIFDAITVWEGSSGNHGGKLKPKNLKLEGHRSRSYEESQTCYPHITKLVLRVYMKKRLAGNNSFEDKVDAKTASKEAQDEGEDKLLVVALRRRENEGTDKSKVSTDKPEVSTDKLDEGTAKLKDGTSDESLLYNVFRDDETLLHLDIGAQTTRSVLTLKPLLLKLILKTKGKKVLEESKLESVLSQREGVDDSERNFDSICLRMKKKIARECKKRIKISRKRNIKKVS
ncbi:hypothetical protein Tco_0819484 [Tanacetum coccineum]|uniref:Uncharacterized protein n=1 Tax=Tanacetum coccineum TaxID=301880 RepID=A0ABQ5A6Q2_9ASTR